MAERALSQIAAEIRSDWTGLDRSPAKPYVDAMANLKSLRDNYRLDSAVSVVAYFLGTCATWRGPEARRVKEELRAMLKRHQDQN